jgi:two-component system LytT family response regulator
MSVETRLTCFIVDDEPSAVELIASYLNDLYPNVEIAGKYYSWRDALNALRSTPPDLCFLDISMPGKSGIDVLKLLSDVNFEIIFVTAHAEYALDAFRFFATGYLLKPLDEKDFSVAMDKAIGRITNRRDASHTGSVTPIKLGIPSSNGIDYVTMADILYFESNNKYTRVVTSEAALLSSYHIGGFRKLITSDMFFSVHQSYIVNIAHVVHYDSNGFIVMSDKTEIPIARSVKKDFLRRFLIASKLK